MAILAARQTLSDAAWVDLKCEEHVRLKPVRAQPHERATVKIEVLSLERIGAEGVEALIRAWKSDGTPIGFGPDGSAEIERIRTYNPAVMVQDPLGTYVIAWQDHRGQQRSLSYREDPNEALLHALTRNVEHFGKTTGRIVKGKVGRTVSNILAKAGSSDADGIDGIMAVEPASDTFATIRASAGDYALLTSTELPACSLGASSTTDQYNDMGRGGFSFNTAALPDTDSIDSATLTLYGTGAPVELGSNEIGVTAFAPASNTTLVAGDFDSFSDTDFVTRIASGSWNTAGDNVFTLNAAGLAYIDATGFTHLMTRLGWDIDNSFGGSWVSLSTTQFRCRYADFTGTGDDPVLSVTHSGAGGYRSSFLLTGVG